MSEPHLGRADLMPSEVHTFRRVWFPQMAGGRQEGLACSCWRSPGVHCPALEKHLLATGRTPLMAAVAAICPLPLLEEINTDDGGPHGA